MLSALSPVIFWAHAARASLSALSFVGLLAFRNSGSSAKSRKEWNSTEKLPWRVPSALRVAFWRASNWDRMYLVVMGASYIAGMTRGLHCRKRGAPRGDLEPTAGEGPKASPSVFTGVLRDTAQRLEWAVRSRCAAATWAEMSGQGWPKEAARGTGVRGATHIRVRASGGGGCALHQLVW